MSGWPPASLPAQQLVDYGISRGDLALMGAVTGLGVGGLQAFCFLSRRRLPGALWWAAVNPPAWALAWLVTSYVITKNVKEHFTIFGASGAILFALAHMARPHLPVPAQRA